MYDLTVILRSPVYDLTVILRRLRLNYDLTVILRIVFQRVFHVFSFFFICLVKIAVCHEVVYDLTVNARIVKTIETFEEIEKMKKNDKMRAT